MSWLKKSNSDKEEEFQQALKVCNQFQEKAYKILSIRWVIEKCISWFVIGIIYVNPILQPLVELI